MDLDFRLHDISIHFQQMQTGPTKDCETMGKLLASAQACMKGKEQKALEDDHLATLKISKTLKIYKMMMMKTKRSTHPHTVRAIWP